MKDFGFANVFCVQQGTVRQENSWFSLEETGLGVLCPQSVCTTHWKRASDTRSINIRIGHDTLISSWWWSPSS